LLNCSVKQILTFAMRTVGRRWGQNRHETTGWCGAQSEVQAVQL
jgi:hypothetical protein